MARKDDDIFRKLDKQKPLVKRKDLQPLSSDAFSSPTAVPRTVHTLRQPPVRKPVSKSAAAKSAEPAGRYNRKQPMGSSQELSVFGEQDSVKTKKPAGKTSQAARKPAMPRTQARSQNAARAAVGVRPKKETAPELDIFTNHTRTVVTGDRSFGHVPSVQRRADLPIKAAFHAPAKTFSLRHELKYYINYRDYVLLKNTLKALISLDSNADENGEYYIRSLYFDDINETALAEKMAGTNTRSKYRIRIYNFLDDNIKFEKKFKVGQYIGKKSFALSRDECDALNAGDCSCLERRTEPLAQEVYLLMTNNMLRPRVIVDYRREAYVSPFENVRITFDKDIKAGLTVTDIFNEHAPTMPVLEQGTMVLEVKFNRYLPEYIKAVLNNVNAAQRSAVSKYVLCRKHE